MKSPSVVNNIKKNFLLIGFMILCFTSCEEDLTCKDFVKGTFYIEKPISKADKYIIVRNGNSQVEYRDKIVDGNGISSHIEWLDECSYRLLFDENKNELTESQRLMNENNGLVIEMIKFNGKCVDYKATLTKKNGESISRNSTMCAE